MIEEPSSSSPAGPVVPRYDSLRWAIRITGIVLMLGGTVYLGVVASKLLTDGSSLILVVGSLIALGLGILVLRIGLSMLRSINARTIRIFSLVFALIYGFILVQILPSSGAIDEHPVLVGLALILCFGLSYGILNSILAQLLLPREER